MSTTPTHRRRARRIVAGLALSAALLGAVAIGDSAGAPRRPRSPSPPAAPAPGRMHPAGNGDLVARVEDGILPRKDRKAAR